MENEAEKIRDHFIHLRDQLKRKGIDAQHLADLLGVKRQTMYQYGFSPDTRGARIVPAESLDRIRLLYAQLHFESAVRGYPAFLDRKLVEWIYNNAEGSISTTSRAHARFLEACRGGTARPGPLNSDPHTKAHPAEELGLRWLRSYFNSATTIDDAIQITGLSAHDVGRIGYTWFNWGIGPTVDQVDALEAICLGIKEAA